MRRTVAFYTAIGGLNLVVALALLALLANGAWAGSHVLGGTHSRGEIQGTCDKVGGQPYGTQNSSGDYGCYTDKGLVTCKENGVCTGWCQSCAAAAPGAV